MTTMNTSNYRIRIEPQDENMGPVYFRRLMPGLVNAVDTEVWFPITARDVSKYPQIPFNPNWQYVDVGCGLAEFIPSLVGRVRKKPIAIEFASFNVMRFLLDHTDARGQEERVQELQRRIQVYTDPSMVRLLNKPLGRAIRDTTLHGSADVVIDSIGPTTYPESEFQKIGFGKHDQALYRRLSERVREYELLLLKRGGQLITRNEVITKE